MANEKYKCPDYSSVCRAVLTRKWPIKMGLLFSQNLSRSPSLPLNVLSTQRSESVAGSGTTEHNSQS